ncbi:MAG: pyridoxal-phosphate-dependent aminotransferase family protein [Roseiflexaceae bacterium]
MTTYRMLIPGPVDVDDAVLKVLGSPQIPHYGPEWAAIYADVVTDLKHLFGTTANVFPIVGSGTTGLEVAIGSMLATGKRMAIVRNGWFGEHMANIAKARGIGVHMIEGEWGRAISVDAVRAELKQHGPFDALGFVYAETSTGALNPVKELAALAKEFGIPSIVDAITGFAGTPLEVDAWDIDVCVSASQKALAAPAGLGFVAVSQKGWDYLDIHPVVPIGWLFDLRTLRSYQQGSPEHPQPATMPPTLVLAVQLRLKQVLAMGKQGYVDHHYRAAARFRKGITSMGIGYLVPDAEATPQVTSVLIPAGKDINEIKKAMKERYGFYTAGGIGPLASKIMRVGHMGKGASDTYIDDALEAFGDILR